MLYAGATRRQHALVWLCSRNDAIGNVAVMPPPSAFFGMAARTGRPGGRRREAALALTAAGVGDPAGARRAASQPAACLMAGVATLRR